MKYGVFFFHTQNHTANVVAHRKNIKTIAIWFVLCWYFYYSAIESDVNSHTINSILYLIYYGWTELYSLFSQRNVKFVISFAIQKENIETDCGRQIDCKRSECEKRNRVRFIIAKVKFLKKPITSLCIFHEN